MIVSATVFLALTNKQTDKTDPLELVKDQIDAFNERDIDRLIENISEDYIWFYVSDDSLITQVSGKESMRKAMEGYYEAISEVALKHR